MPSIEELLVKYFQQNCSEAEKDQVEQFRQNHPKEFELIQRLWEKREDIQLKNFDTKAAWNNIQRTIRPKQVWYRQYYRQIAAAIVLLLVASLVLWYQAGTNIPPSELITISGQEAPIILEDGSKVWLHRDASLQFPKQFNGDTRLVTLTGEAFFEIAKNPQRPFIVTVEDIKVKVLGTSFNIQPTNNLIEVSVATGLVEVNATHQKEGIQVKPGYRATVNEAGIAIAAVNPNFQSWRTGKFVFDNRPITEVINALNRYYQDSIPYPKDTSCQVTASFNQETLQEVKDNLALICGLSF